MRWACAAVGLILVAACGGDDETSEPMPFDFRTCMEAAETVGDENRCQNIEADIEAAVDEAVRRQCPLTDFDTWRDCRERVTDDVRSSVEAP